MGRVKELPCALCDAPPPSDAHHILTGRTPGVRSGDFLCLPLCKECHQGKNGIHGDKALWRVYKVSEHDLLNQTLERLYG